MTKSVVSAVFRGVDEFTSTTRQIDVNVDKATLASVRAAQRKIKAAVRKNLSGAPRWNQRGASPVYPEQVVIDGAPKYAPRSGGPGVFTGALRAGVGGVRRPVNRNGTFHGGVGVGGDMTNNFKKRQLERKFPYFEPAVSSVEPQLGEVFDNAWSRAIHRVGGVL